MIDAKDIATLSDSNEMGEKAFLLTHGS